MPTPVSTARQCLTQEAAHALDEAVSVARRRGHAQTTSLHAVSALLSLPSSPLREACARARNAAYSPRLQFKALELCLSVSLDRVPSTQLTDDPPVSNSLMAAIKRSQANQRRQPENFHLYQQIQQQQQQSSISCVKVELQHLVLSILDDPVVSRVFGESGFRSSDIKLAILRPLRHLFKYSRTRVPPLFLCNLTENSDPGRRSFSFPFPGFPGFFNGDENSRRIGEILVRSKSRNPLLVGVGAYDALRSFTEILERRKENVLPVELSRLDVICIENEVSRFVSENSYEKSMNLRFEEVGKIAKQSLGPGLVVNFGDLKGLFSGHTTSGGEAVNYIVSQLTRLLEIYGGRLWLIGAVSSYEMYLKFANIFPSIEKDWDLQLLPITSLKAPMTESYPRSSLMESFVPFGGFFSTPSDLKGHLSGSYQCLSRCHLCNDKCEQEVTAVSKGVSTASVADHYQSSLPSWLQVSELSKNNGLDVEKAKDDGVLFSAKVKGVQKKWDNICQRLHHFPEAGSYQVGSPVQTIFGFQFTEERKENSDNCSRSKSNASPNGNLQNVKSCSSIDLESNCTSEPRAQFPLCSEAKNESLMCKLLENPSKTEDPSSVGNGHLSPASVSSVTTELGLGIFNSPARKELKETTQNHGEILQDVSGCFSANCDLVNGSISNKQAQSASHLCPNFHGHYDPGDVKMLFKALTERIGWQDEAITLISQTIAHCRTTNRKRHGPSLKGDIWFNFLGPDRFGKKKIALCIAEILCGSSENFINVDLSSHDGMIHANTISGRQEMIEYDRRFRGKTVVDYIGEELSKKQFSLVFLENVDKADHPAQYSLSQAIKTGKYSDSHGREVSINNAIFVTTSDFTKGSRTPFYQNSAYYSEERILKAKGRPIQILLGDDSMGHNWNESPITVKGKSNPVFFNKRKLMGKNENIEQPESLETYKRAHKASNLNLDLNLSAEENEAPNTDSEISDNDYSSENSKAWMEDFFDLVDATVVFKPFDFDALAEKILKEIGDSFHKIVESECLLEIESKVMEQILAAACLSDGNQAVEDWVELVLGKGLAEAKKRYNLNANSVVRLVTCEGLFLEEQSPYLPTRIILN